MSSAPVTALLVLALLATASAARADASLREQRPRPLLLSTEPSGTPLELRISPTDSTVVLFDSPLARVEVERPEHFRRVRVAGDTLTLVPAAGLAAGARTELTVSFQDGGAPERGALVLVVDATSTGRQFEVYRRPRPPSPPQELDSLREENQRLRQEVERLRAVQARPRGLAGLLVDSALTEGNFAVRRIDSMLVRSEARPLRVHAVWSYRAGTEVALVLELDNLDKARSWQARSATLEGARTGPKALSVSTEAPIGPGERSRVVVGGEVTRKEARDTFTLTLREAGGGPPLSLSNITFP